MGDYYQLLSKSVPNAPERERESEREEKLIGVGGDGCKKDEDGLERKLKMDTNLKKLKIEQKKCIKNK